MPKIDIGAVPAETGSSYPEPHASQMGRRAFQELGRAGGLTQFGVVLVTMHPGDISSLRHWHSHEDEFVVVLSGELELVQDAGAVTMRAGDCAAFPKGDPDGHHLRNVSGSQARFLAIGPNDPDDICTYSDVDLVWHAAGRQFTRKDGSPVEG